MFFCMATEKPAEEHFQIVARGFLAGDVAPFLGAGVNLWPPPDNRPPSTRELARSVAGAGAQENELDLLRVSQHSEITEVSGPLYPSLHNVFAKDFERTRLHDL